MARGYRAPGNGSVHRSPPAAGRPGHPLGDVVRQVPPRGACRAQPGDQVPDAGLSWPVESWPVESRAFDREGSIVRWSACESS
jgi:hypothetical protein